MIAAFINSTVCFLLFAVLSLPLPSRSGAVSSRTFSDCPGSRSAAKLTGWTLNNKTPVGTAKYDESNKSLEISVESVGLPDGTRLSVFIAEEKIGEIEPLKDGAGRVVLNHAVPDQARVRVLAGDRPVVSANLKCVDATGPTTRPTPVPTSSPSPSPSLSPSPSVSPSPSPSVSPGPTAEPTPDPMPKHSPVPSPSPR